MPEATSVYDGQTHVQQTNVPSNFLEKQMCAMTDQVGYRLITDLILQSKFMTFSTRSPSPRSSVKEQWMNCFPLKDLG